MSTRFNHHFWQLREIQRVIDQLQPQLRALDIARAVDEQMHQLERVRDSYTLPPDYLSEVSRLRETIEASGQMRQLTALLESHNSAFQSVIDRQRELEEVSRQFDVYSYSRLPGQHVLESLASTEALLETARLNREWIEAAIQPQIAYLEFAQKQLDLAATAPEVARVNRLMAVDTAADLLEEMSTGVELATLMSQTNPEATEAPKSTVNVFTELNLEIERVDLEDTETDIEQTVLKSRAAQVARQGAQIVQLVYNLNVEAEREGQPTLFKPTSKTQYACFALPAQVATDERSFAEIVDHLYFLLYEGSGAAARLTEKCSEDRLAALWRVKHLRLGFRHDVDHGKDQEVAKKNQLVGEAYRSLIGKVAPQTRADWCQAQIELYGQLVEMLRTIWFGEETVNPKNQAVLAFLDDWSREPDDKGEEWWSSFEKELEENRKFNERDIE